jgi:ribonuclease VapC
MPLKSKAVVLDSWSIIAYLEDEPSARNIEEIIVNAHEHKIPLMTSVVNAGEVWYIVARKTSAENADEAIRDIQRLGVEFVEADWMLTKTAAAIKSKARMSYADCFAAALAKKKQAVLVTGDPEFKQISTEVKVHWV